MTPIDVKARIGRLARQYPDLVDVIDLPNRTQGYRRTAAAYVGDPATAAIVVESVKFGDQGMNGVQVRTVDPAPRAAAVRPLPRPGAHGDARDRTPPARSPAPPTRWPR